MARIITGEKSIPMRILNDVIRKSNVRDAPLKTVVILNDARELTKVIEVFCSRCGNQEGLCTNPYIDCITGERTKPCDKLKENHGNVRNGCKFFRKGEC
jgi:hypothetical protein